METIGGTWGSATSALARGEIVPAFVAVERIIKPVADQIRKADNLMANYLMKYFNLLAKQITNQHQFLAPDARMAYVVGCSWLKGIYVDTMVLLPSWLEGLGLGYKVASIGRFQRRPSGKNWQES